MFGVARNFRKTHGEEAFNLLARAAFADADADNSGSINASELKDTLQKTGINLTEQQVNEVLQKYDANKSGLIDESEWFALVSDLVDGTFAAPPAASGSSTSAPPATETEQLRSEVRGLRFANQALEARVATLETHVRRLLAMSDGSVNGGLSASSSASKLPTASDGQGNGGLSTSNSASSLPGPLPRSASATSVGSADGGFAKSIRPTTAPKEVRKTCPYCAHSWLDKYGKNECPKCLNPLSAGGYVPRMPGEAVTNKMCASSAMESEFGSCAKGGVHTFRFGKCTKCGKGEGAALADQKTGGECAAGGKHVFKFTKCVKCGAAEF